MYTYDMILEPQDTVHMQKPWARTAVCGFLRAVGTAERGGFPCTFARTAVARRSLYFAFADSVDDAAELDAARQSLSQYLRVWRTLPKAEEHLHVLVILIAPDPRELSLQDYHAQAWRLMADWIESDTSAWPDTVPHDPHSPYWALCFESVQLFVNVSCPAHKMRPSRNLGGSLALVVQPRESFDVVAGSNARGDRVREIIRARIDRFDHIGSPSCLGSYHRGELEWPQYALPDSAEGDAGHIPGGCPIRALSLKRAARDPA